MARFNEDKVMEAITEFRVSVMFKEYDSPGERLAAHRNANRIAEDAEYIVQAANRDTVLNRQVERIVEFKKVRDHSAPGSYAYEKADRELGNLMMSVATVLAHGRLKRYIGSDRKFRNNHLELKKGIARWFNKQGLAIQNAIDALDRITYIAYNSKDELETLVSDDEEEYEILKRIRDLGSCADAQALVSAAYTELMEWVAKVDDDTDVVHLLMPTPKLIEQSVMYRDGTIKDRALWQYGLTNPIRESGKAVGRYLESLVKRTENEIALDDTEAEIYDPVAGEDVTIRRYRRVSQWAMDGDADDFPVPNREVQDLIDRCLSECKFTPKQRTLFYNRYVRCWSMAHICDKMKITEHDYTQTFSDDIYPKVAALIGVGKVNRELPPKSVVAYEKNDYIENGMDAIPVGYYDSIGKASEMTGVDKSAISRVVAGKRQSAGGMVWIEIGEEPMYTDNVGIK